MNQVPIGGEKPNEQQHEAAQKTEQFVEQVMTSGDMKKTCPMTMGGNCQYKADDAGAEKCKRCGRVKGH